MKANPKALKYYGALYDKFDVVYCGSVHHHFYKDALKYGASPFLWVKKLMALTNKYLILDGPFDMDDGALNKMAGQNNWTPGQRATLNFERIASELRPHFELVRKVKNERRRYTAVFKRVMPDIGYIDDKAVRRLIENHGIELECNKARPPGSMYRISQDYRIKYDEGLLTDGMYFILNSMPQHFAATKNIIVKDGQRIGDITEWIASPAMEVNPGNIEHSYQNFLKMNQDMAAVGLVEPHLKLMDYKWRGGKLLDVDVDMVRHASTHTKEYLDSWFKNKSEYYPERKADFQYLVDNWASQDVYYDLIQRGGIIEN
jgi:hypothetical protein